MKNFCLYFCLCLFFTVGAEPALAQDSLQTVLVEDTDQQNQPSFGFDQDNKDVFEWKMEKDLPIMLGGSIMTIAGFIVKARVPPLSEQQILALDPNEINFFDRAATRQYRPADAQLSDLLLAVSIASPFGTLASRPVRKELAPILVMYFETATLAGGLTNFSKGLFKRKRPFVYNQNVPLTEKQTIKARHSFFSGHVSNSAAFSFLTAYLVDRYAKKDGWKWAAWSGAVLIPGTVGYWRYTSGKHFPSDILVGYLLGAGTGILIPAIHQAQLPEEVSLNVQPLPYGIMMTLTF